LSFAESKLSNKQQNWINHLKQSTGQNDYDKIINLLEKYVNDSKEKNEKATKLSKYFIKHNQHSAIIAELLKEEKSIAVGDTSITRLIGRLSSALKDSKINKEGDLAAILFILETLQEKLAQPMPAHLQQKNLIKKRLR
jgi:hypothetical protein